MVAAFLKLGIPTMMSALPRRAISSRMAGVRAVWGTGPPYHHGGGAAHSQGGARTLPTRDRHRRPVLADRARPVSAVGAAEAQVAEAHRTPRPDPRVDRRQHVGAEADELRLLDDRFELPLPLEQGDVEQRLPVEPEHIDDD